MFAHALLALLMLQPVSSGGEESLQWTEIADPDPNYVPPPLTAEELALERAAERAQRARAAEMIRIEDEFRRAEERVNDQLRRTCETIRTAQLTAGLRPDPPTCSQRR